MLDDRHTGFSLAVRVFILSSFVISCNGAGTIITAEVNEDLAAGFLVHRFDRPPSGEQYSLFRSADSGYSLFAISNDGVVTTRKPLVYTVGKPNKYSLFVVRRLQGQTEGGKAWTLEITVKDVENYQPTFGADVYHGRVAEKSPEDTVVDGLEKCFAEDRDESGIGGYRIVSGNERNYFKVLTSQKGNRKFLVLQTTTVPIIRDPKSPYITLTVQAIQTGTTKIQVYIEDANDHEPKFTKDKYEAKIEEDSPVQSSVNVQVSAKDNDVGTNGGLYYYLDPLEDYFMVDAITGTIKVARPLDYSKKNSFSLTVFAVDRGNPQKRSSTKVDISIEKNLVNVPPANSNNPGANTSPFFPEGPYITSIRQDFPINGALLLIRAADKDPPGPNKQLTYSLSGSGSGDFKIDPSSGLVTLAKRVSYTTGGANTYTLTVKATDGNGLSADTKLTIDIQYVDQNRFAPKFKPQQEVQTVKEDRPVGTVVATVSATDADVSVPDKTIQYSIIQGSGMGVFTVDPTTGQVKIDAPLDHEKRSFYDLVIKAEDRAIFPKSSNLYLMINVEDVDDNNPSFTQPIFIAKVPEKAAKETFVTVVRAEDPDLNPSITYSIKTPSVPFIIESSTGVVRTERTLDPSLGEMEYELVIEAISNSNIAKGQLNVTVISNADSPPTFKNTPYFLEVPENQGMISNLMCVAAVDPRGQVVQYRFTSPDPLFAIDANSGRLSVVKSFDYDIVDSYKIPVQAVNINSKKASVTDIDIKIENREDLPSFSKSAYTVSIAESTAKGTTINTGIRIIDQDTPLANFICSLENVGDLKVLDYLTAVQQGDECKIVTKKSLDSSIVPQFIFTMQAMDTNFHHMITTAAVTVKVTDENNYKPVFSQTSYWVSVSSDKPSGTSVLQVSTIDDDLGLFKDVTYQLTSSDRFTIEDNSGWIVTTNKLLVNTRFQMKVKAIDGGQKESDEVSVYVTAYDISDTPLTFNQDSYTASIRENEPKNTEVIEVKATKSGSSTGVSYELVGGFKENGKDMFSIDANSGKVLLIETLDRERKASYNLIIRAKYTGGSVELATEVRCTVNVDDINDQSPRFTFEKDPKIFTVDNYSPANTLIGTVRAIDLDAGNNGKVSYSLAASSSGIDDFKIDAEKGTLATRRKLTQVATYNNVILVATDGGSPQKVTQKTITIEITEAKEPPTFEKSSYTFPVQENTRVGEAAATVKAKYADSTAFLKYSILSGNTDSSFCIDAGGKISVARPLDREKVNTYTLTVQVARKDEKATTTVILNVMDINDDSPVFEKSVYEFKVMENAGISTSVGKVVAVDLDSGLSGTVTYNILQSVNKKSSGLFTINSDTGVITTVNTLDYEDINTHVLFVQAMDKGASVQLRSITKVQIYVEDINDNSPKFTAASYRAKVPLDAAVGDHVLQVTATDLDSEKNGHPTYEVVGGNGEGAFSISRENGLITVAKSLTTVAADRFTLRLQAKDRGSSPRTAQVDVKINVFFPDGPPKFIVSPIVVKLTEGLAANRRVAVVKAATSEALKYEITSGNTNNMFKINPSTGEILTTRELDHEEAPRYELIIVALDSRHFQAQVTVVIQVTNINDNKPVFPGEIDGQIDRKVSGPFSKSMVVTRLGAIDKDVGDQLQYKITPASVYDNFEVDNQGQLIAKNDLSTVPLEYRFKITATDNGSPSQSHSTNVRIVFVNYRPKQQPVRAMVPESTPVNTVITQVPKYFPTGKFEIIFPEKTNFTIDNQGMVRLKSPLNFEKQAFHLITVRERQTIGKLTNDIDVEIYVVDLNDNKPFFTMTSLFGNINKNARAGANVYQLSARDLDSGSNGLVGFQLLSPKSPFTINPFTNKIEVARGLWDKERYYPEALPFDYGRPRNNGSKTTIDVVTAKIPPLFSKGSYRFSVSERAHIGALIGTIEAKSASGARLDYTITEGNTYDNFKVKSDGKLVVNSLFRNSTSQFSLKVKAEEQIPRPLHSSVQVLVDVISANDFHPYFEKLIYTLTLSENTDVGTIIETVKAFDCDCPSSCECARGHLKYDISPRTYFVVDEDKGQVMISKQLDFEKFTTYLLRVTATDTGAVTYTAVCFIIVTITNHNDNAPVFSSSAYEFRVTENANVGQDLAAVVATDDDGDKVIYKIVIGSGEFTINADTGVLQRNNDFKKDKNEYTLTVRAEDVDKKFSDSKVRFSIEHTNSVRPKFTKCGKATVDENLPKGQVIYTVEATDSDKGRFGEIEYSIVPVGGQDFFVINNRTGDVSTTAMFDREKEKSYTVIIRAEDGGHGKKPEERLLSYCSLHVEINDVNDNAPKFATRNYEANIQNNKPIGTPVLTVKAYDLDTGSNAKVYYTLKFYNDKFEIEAETGVIKTRKALSSSDVSKELLTVVASNRPAARDSQTNEQDRETTVEIYISNQPSPECTEPLFRASVKESVPAGTDISLVVDATAKAAGDKEVRFSFVKANPDAEEKFKITTSGSISTASQLNFEALPENDKKFRLQVRAQQSGTNLFSTCDVEITVEDVNDDTPTFDLGSYDARVLENVGAGQEVLKPIATDRDQGEAGKVIYSLKAESDADNFKIDSTTGLITTTKTFDREAKDRYVITVIATDKGTPRPLTEEVTVRVLVVDQNDMPPKFNKTKYTATVAEDTRPGTVILRNLIAYDRDIGDNAMLTYFISGGDMSGAFAVKTVRSNSGTYGVLVVNGKLDYETKKSYNLFVSATDGRSSDRTSVEITIRDVNDVAPVFPKPIYTTRIAEGTSSGVEIMRLTATDIDSSSITYRLQASVSDYFHVVSANGVAIIKTASKKLDREKTSVMLFELYASDTKHVGVTEIQVNITDVNDSPPRFPDDQRYVGYIKESQAIGTSIMYVQAVDDDALYVEKNVKITYELTNNADNKFRIDKDTGKVTSLVVFNRDTHQSSYTITVRATNEDSNNKLTASHDATIYIVDANTHNPKFTQAIYRGTVPENAPPGYRVAAVTATDGDIGPNAELEYVVISGNDPHVFYLNPYNGTVHVSGIVDYEVKRSYDLTVNVSDRGVPMLQGAKSARVLITVTDTNDNAPVFDPNEYRKNVLENVPVGTVVARVTATDADSGTNAKFTFAIKKADVDDSYRIEPDPKNSNIGLVRTRLRLDREKAPINHVIVTATDTGGLEGRADVWITLIDVNDNGPWFVPPYFEGKIKEELDAAQFVTRLSAYDPDPRPNNGPFTYSITNGTVRNNFGLVEPTTLKNATSNMNSNGRFNREEKQTWKIGVTAVDSGNPKRSNFTYVYVDVEDVNDNEPFDGSMTIIVNAYKGQFLCGSIGKPYYRDDDYDGDKNTYAIDSQSPGSYFTIDENSGIITASPNIPMGRYSLKVKITETNRGSNRKTVTSSIRVLVRRVDPSALKNGVTLQFANLRKVEYFVGDYYEDVERVLRNVLGTVEVFSVEKAPDTIMAVNVHFAAKSGDSYISRLDVINKLNGRKSDLQTRGLEVSAIGIDACAKEREKVGQCINVIEPTSKCTVASGDYGKVPAPQSSITVVSMDVTLKDKYVSVITPQGNCSHSNPCLHGGTCHDSIPYGYMVCQCSREYQGPQCQMTTRTFKGNSYIWLPKISAYDLRDVSFEFMTEYPNGLLLYQGPREKGGNNGAKDFLAVFLRNGYIFVRLSFGSDPVTINVTRGARLDDKEWHSVTIKRDVVQRKVVRVIIDKCEKATVVEENGRVFENRDTCEVSKQVLGKQTYLNGFGPLQVGGADTDISWLGVPTEGFKGCIRKIIYYETMYDLKNPLKVVNAPEGCEPAAACPNCNNHGYCEPGLKKSTCVCDLGYSGDTCNGRSPPNYYKESSFSQYLLNTERARRGIMPAPKSITNEFYSTIALKVKLDTDMKNCVLFLSSNSLGTEFNRVDVKDKVIRYIFRLGDRMKVLSIPGFNITDGKYHSIVIKREGNYASMQIDYSGYVAGNTGGVHKLLNMGGGSFFTGGLPNVTEVRVIEAIVLSGGNTILRTADGRVLASGIGADGSGGTSFGSGMPSTLITVKSNGETSTSSIVDGQGIFASGYGVVSVGVNKTKDGKDYIKVLTGRRIGSFGTAIGNQGVFIKNKYPETEAHLGGVPLYDINGKQVSVYGSGFKWTLPESDKKGTQTGSSNGGSKGPKDKAITVIGDFGGCTAANRFNGVNLDNDKTVDIRRQNVVPGCPCATGFCANGGTCFNADPPYCVCPPGWSGVTCETIITAPNPGQRPGTRWMNPGVIAMVLVVLLAVLAITLFVLLKKRAPPPVVPITLEDGHVHDNIRPYHDEGAGEEDNFGYDITQLMKYTYIEGGGGGGYGGGGGGYGGGGGGYGGDGYGGAGGGGGYGKGGGYSNGSAITEENITVAEDKPLLQAGNNGNGRQFGVTTITRRRVINPDSMDVGNFINQRVGEANGEYFIAHDSLHIFRYEGDDSDVDDLSELGDSDNEGDDDDEQSFDFLNQWGRKFENLNKIYNID